MPENTSITILSGTKGISDSAFSSCNGLISITIPNTVLSIGNKAFYDCTKLFSVTFQGRITSEKFSKDAFNESKYEDPEDYLITYSLYDDLRNKYLVGGIGTYTNTRKNEKKKNFRSSIRTWDKQ